MMRRTRSYPSCRTPRRPIGAGAALTLVLAALSPLSLSGQTDGTRRFEFGAFFGGIDDESEFAPGNGSIQMDRGLLFGAHMSWILPSSLYLQTDFARSADLHWVDAAFYTTPDPTAIRAMSRLSASAALGYQIEIHDRIEVFGSAGGGWVRWHVDGLGAEAQPSAVVGAGGRLFLSNALALRTETRWRYAGDAMQGLRAASGNVTDRVRLWTIEPTVGLSWVAGRGSTDGDGDGIRDHNDACLDTPMGAYVDNRGCPRDQDGDGVFDGLDGCENTPAGAVVSTRGCPLDADSDGIADGLDRCPETMTDQSVDETGCARDRDGDGVADRLDACPESVPGEAVDGRGCGTDSDLDGISNQRDVCPNTASGSVVDDRGCPVNRIQEELEESGRVVFNEVLFDTDQATPRPASRVLLDRAAEALLRNPTLEVEIQGHTDAAGPDRYNQNLSERRAEAVLWYLQENFPALAGPRITARGYGESRPVASNDTEAGRERNRRVEFVVKNRP